MIKSSIFILLLVNLLIKPEVNASIFNDLNNISTTNRVFAHASGMGLTPDGNTLLAAMRSIYYKVDGLEMDIRMTKDNQYVLYHDDTVQQYNYDDLQRQLVLPWTQTVPKLRDMFDLLESVKLNSNKDIDVLFDIKRAEDVEGILNYTYSQNFTNRYGLVSYDFTRDILDNGKKWSKMMGIEIPTMVIISNNISFGLYNTRMWGYDIASFLYEDLNLEIINKARQLNPPLNVTCLLVNDVNKINDVKKLGVLGFGTDYPEKVMNSHKLRNEQKSILVQDCQSNEYFSTVQIFIYVYILIFLVSTILVYI